MQPEVVKKTLLELDDNGGGDFCTVISFLLHLNLDVGEDVGDDEDEDGDTLVETKPKRGSKNEWLNLKIFGISDEQLTLHLSGDVIGGLHLLVVIHSLLGGALPVLFVQVETHPSCTPNTIQATMHLIHSTLFFLVKNMHIKH